LPPLEAWEKVNIKADKYLDDIHARFGCITCHGGTPETDDKDAAHESLVRDPSEGEACAICHPEIAKAHKKSLHGTLTGFLTVLKTRSDDAHWPQLEVAYKAHCTACHASCGQCHVSRPTSTGGGFLSGHRFKKIPNMKLNCTACHGSRVEDEYKGLNEGVPGDVHWLKEGMSCFECHSEDELHGALGEASHRYDGPPTPGCVNEECHTDVSPDDGIEQHDEEHLTKLQCEVCHSTDYKHCFNCHVQKDEKGVAFFKSDPSQLMVKIGRNPRKSPERPWEYVLLRHVPVARDTFDYYGQDLLSNFDARPTWVYATPHNTQRVAPQAQSCNNCHGNPEVFLTAADVAPDELEANKDVIVEEVPPAQ